jgi:hypothetical protein
MGKMLGRIKSRLALKNVFSLKKQRDLRAPCVQSQRGGKMEQQDSLDFSKWMKMNCRRVVLASVALMGILILLFPFMITSKISADDKLKNTAQRPLIHAVEQKANKDALKKSQLFQSDSNRGRVYHLEPDTGRVRFGYGARGERLPAGEPSPSANYRQSSSRGDESSSDSDD